MRYDLCCRVVHNISVALGCIAYYDGLADDMWCLQLPVATGILCGLYFQNGFVRFSPKEV